MARPPSPLKTALLWTVTLGLMALAVHVVVEAAVQGFLAPRSGIARQLAEFRDKAQSAGASPQAYGRGIGLDPYLGWAKDEARIHEPKAPQQRTLLFVGDSVTAGHDVRGGEEDFPALLAARFGGAGVKVANLAARGYGVDQMWLKLLTEAPAQRPDAIVLAYIPHDLLRPATDFNFGLPKPRFSFDGTRAGLALAEGMDDYMAGYEAARAGFRLGAWFIAHYWRNKEYYAPDLFTGYYERLYRHLGEGLAKLSHELEAPIVVAKLTNRYRFRGSDKLSILAETNLAHDSDWDKADLRHLDLDGCVLPKAKAQGIDAEQEFAHHPGPAGHRLLADCLGDYLAPLLAQ